VQRNVVHAVGRYDMLGSISRVGAAGDNADMESFFSLLQENVLDRRRWDGARVPVSRTRPPASIESRIPAR